MTANIASDPLSTAVSYYNRSISCKMKQVIYDLKMCAFC